MCNNLDGGVVLVGTVKLELRPLLFIIQINRLLTHTF